MRREYFLDSCRVKNARIGERRFARSNTMRGLRDSLLFVTQLAAEGVAEAWRERMISSSQTAGRHFWVSRFSRGRDVGPESGEAPDGSAGPLRICKRDRHPVW